MSVLRCNYQGCNKDLWYQNQNGQQVVESNSTCMECRQVILCLNHFKSMWDSRQGSCPNCGQQRWLVKLLPNTPFSPHLQANVLRSGGQLLIVDRSKKDQKTRPSAPNHLQLQAPQRRRSHETIPNHNTPVSKHRPLNRAARAYKQSSVNRTDKLIPPSVPYPDEHAQTPRPRPPQSPLQAHPQPQRNHSTGTPIASLHVAARNAHVTRNQHINPNPPVAGYDAYANPERALSYDQTPALSFEQSNTMNIPKSWRLITRTDLPEGARGVGGGIALCRETPSRVLMMDDDRIIRNLEVEGDILSITQSPRKRRLIVERVREGEREIVWLKSKEIQGFITNPLDDERDVFGAHFINDSSFIYFAQRPDERVDLREGRFVKARRIQSRVVGVSIKGSPLAPKTCHRAQRVFFFKEVSEGEFLPVCRRVSDGDDLIMGELCERPRVLSASRDAHTVSWIDHKGKVWASHQKFPMTQIGKSDTRLLAVSHDGKKIAWVTEGELNTYSIDQRQHQTWTTPNDLLAIGWRSDSI